MAVILSVTGALNREAIIRLRTSEHPVVREFALAVIARLNALDLPQDLPQRTL